MPRSRHLPNINQISVLAATVLLAYALSSFVRFPTRDISFTVLGIILDFELNVHTVVALLVAGMAAAGTNLLIQEHPAQNERYQIQHWLLPTLTAWVIGVPLSQQSTGAYWWLGISLGGGALILVLVAEYIAVDPDDFWYALATIWLSAVAFALFLLLTISLRTSQFRLSITLPAITLAIGLASLRTLHLRLNGTWAIVPTIAIMIIVAEIGSALYYLPLQPVTFGLVLLGPAYALTSLFADIAEKKPLRQIFIEPALIVAIIWLVAFWVR